jgi:hypothetical protein
MARPRKIIDIEQLEKIAEKQWSFTEIAAFFRVSEKTINRRYVQIIEDARQRGRTKLRDLQWKRALEGSDRVLLHMSAHYLGQNQKLELAVEKIPDEVLIQEAQRRINEKNNKP